MAMDVKREIGRAVDLLDTDAACTPDEVARWRSLSDALLAEPDSADPLAVEVIWRLAERVLGQGSADEAQALFEAASELAARLDHDDLDDHSIGLVLKLALRIDEIDLPRNSGVRALQQLAYSLCHRDPHLPLCRITIRLAIDLNEEGFMAEAAAVYRGAERIIRRRLETELDPECSSELLYFYQSAAHQIEIAGDPELAHEHLVAAAPLLDRLPAVKSRLLRAQHCVALAQGAIDIARIKGRAYSDAGGAEFSWLEDPETPYPIILEQALVGLDSSNGRRFLNEQARQWLSQAQTYLETAGTELNPSDHAASAMTGLESLALASEVEIALGNYPNGLSIVDMAKKFGRSFGLPIGYRSLFLTHVEATALFEQGRFEDALHVVETDLPLVDNNLILPHYGPVRAHLLLLLCECEIGLASTQERPLVADARATIEHRIAEAIVIDNNFMNMNAAPLSDLSRFRSFGPVLRRLPRILGILYAMDGLGRGPAEALYHAVLQRKFRVTNETIRTYRDAASDPSLAAILRDAKDARRRFARHDVEGGGELERFRTMRRALSSALDDAEIELSWSVGTGALGEIEVAHVRDALPPGTTLVDYVIAAPPGAATRYGAFVVDRDVRYLDLGETALVDEAIRELLEAIAAKGEEEDLLAGIRRAAEPVSRLLLKPALTASGDPDSLIISPFGAWLSRVPFALLPASGDVPLVERYPLTLTPSALLLVDDPRARQPARSTPIILGGPDFGLGFPEGELPQFEQKDLPYARQEALDIASMLGVDAVVGVSAVKKAIEKARAPSVLHLATHGLEPSQPLPPHGQRTLSMWRSWYVGGIPVVSFDDFGGLGVGSDDLSPKERADARADWLKKAGSSDAQAHMALVFGGFHAWANGFETPDEVGNALLSANEFAALDLHGTELVVLSACGTGLGQLISTESAVLGFRRTAFIAGAQSLVSTLWRVPDQPTAEFMKSFYTHLVANQDCGRALQRACQYVRARHRHPKNWAAFICEGCPGAIDMATAGTLSEEPGLSGPGSSGRH